MLGAPHSGRATVGDALPPLFARKLNGRFISLRSYEGKPLWLNLFATWCPPCNIEMPEIERHYRHDMARGLAVVGLDQEENPLLVRRFTQSRAVSFDVLIDDGAVAHTFGIGALPVSVFIDAKGIIRSVRYGQLASSDMDASLAMILH